MYQYTTKTIAKNVPHFVIGRGENFLVVDNLDKHDPTFSAIFTGMSSERRLSLMKRKRTHRLFDD